MKMDETIQKRSQLLNYFFNQSVEYTKEDILAREYAALSFSPKEEYVDVFKTDYDDVLTPITDLQNDLPEVLIKGIVVDVDMKKSYCIVHIQNKADNISVSVDTNVLKRYGDYLQKGHLLLIKGHTFSNKVYMHFLIDYNSDDSFILENNYLNKESERFIDDIDYTNRYDLIGLVRQIKYFKSKKSGKQCIRLQVYEKGKEKTYITCKNNPAYPFPTDLTAGMFVSYSESNNSAFCNNLQRAQL